MLHKLISAFGRVMYPLCKLSAITENLSRALYSGYKGAEFKAFGERSLIKPGFRLLVGGRYISIGKKCFFGADIQLTAWDTYFDQKFLPEITFGDNCQIGDGSHITAINRIVIGDNVLTGKYVLITDNSHGAIDYTQLNMAPAARPLESKGEVVIEDNVWIGEKASIMPGVSIGRGAIIAANAVVTHDIPPYCVAAGIPARIIKNLDPKAV